MLLQDGRTEGGQGDLDQAGPDEEEKDALYQQKRETKLIYSDHGLQCQVAVPVPL